MSPSTPWWNLLKLQAKYPRGKSKLPKGISTFLKAYKQWNLQTQILSSLHVNPWRTRIIYKWHQYYVTYIHRLLFLNTCKKVVKVLVAQLYPTFCDPMDCSPPGSSVHRVLQTRTLEWVAITSSGRSSQPREVLLFKGSLRNSRSGKEGRREGR